MSERVISLLRSGVHEDDSDICEEYGYSTETQPNSTLYRVRNAADSKYTKQRGIYKVMMGGGNEVRVVYVRMYM